MFDGVEHWLSAWIKTPKNGGEKYMSLSVGKPKGEKRETPKRDDDPVPFDDSIPF
jgi:hypothetical protein